jgi:hypothetical protein
MTLRRGEYRALRTAPTKVGKSSGLRLKRGSFSPLIVLARKRSLLKQF